MTKLLRKKDKNLAIYFNFTFRYIDDVLSLNNSTFNDYVERIYPIEQEIKYTTVCLISSLTSRIQQSASYLHLHLEFNSLPHIFPYI